MVDGSRMPMTWTGWDGSVWSLTDPASQVRLKQGVRGLSMPPVRRYSSASAGVPGSRWRGASPEERQVFWPLAVHTAPGQGWVDQDSAFFRTLDPERPGIWRVQQPDGGARSLRCRFVDDGQHTYVTGPAGIGWAFYGITLVAEQPYWEGEPLVRYFNAAPPVLFFGTPQVFSLDPGSTVATATVDNPGDVDAYPVWTVTGPTTGVTLGVGGRLIEVPFALADGEVLVVDPRPTAQTAIMSTGVERTAELGEADFAPIPAGESLALSLDLAGAGGSVQVSLTPLHYRAW